MEIEITGLDEVLKVLHPRVYQKALNRTVNDIGGKMKTQTTKEVRKTYNVKAKDIKSFMQIKRSRYSDMKYQMQIRSSPLNAIRFGAKVLKQRGKVSVRIKKDSGRKVLNRTFLSKSGKAVLQREKGTQKIKAVSTVSIPQMFNDKILKKADEMARKEFGKKLQDNFDFYIGKV
ncbi:MAG TPA: hypothetical protein ENK66_09205 [Arcobacter sp.]|nr:hypothetical protein [Arcobacter sp.]